MILLCLGWAKLRHYWYSGVLSVLQLQTTDIWMTSTHADTHTHTHIRIRLPGIQTAPVDRLPVRLAWKQTHMHFGFVLFSETLTYTHTFPCLSGIRFLCLCTWECRSLGHRSITRVYIRDGESCHRYAKKERVKCRKVHSKSWTYCWFKAERERLLSGQEAAHVCFLLILKQLDP